MFKSGKRATDLKEGCFGLIVPWVVYRTRQKEQRLSQRLLHIRRFELGGCMCCESEMWRYQMWFSGDVYLRVHIFSLQVTQSVLNDARVHLLKNLIIEGDLWATYTTLQSTR